VEPGVTITVKGKDYIVPPLDVGGWKSTQEARAALVDVEKYLTNPFTIPADKLEALQKLVLAAITLNYPEMTIADLDRMPLSALMEMIGAIQEQAPQGEGAGSPAMRPSRTGEPSTASSRPRRAGRSGK